MEIQTSSVAGTLESSDIMVSLEPAPSKIEIELDSIVEKQFGQDIRNTIGETLASLQVTKARIKAVDKGALDCVIRARVKTAVYRACGNPAYVWNADGAK
jgi:citrate lyase subunit gamma (acyl carrier protein)